MVMFRSTEPLLHKILAHLKTKFPTVAGGGHDHAGTISFVQSQQKEILEEILNFLRM